MLPFTQKAIPIVTLCLFLTLTTIAFSLDHSHPPCDNFDLTNWYLTLPCDSDGNVAPEDIPHNVEFPELSTGAFYDSPEYKKYYIEWFHTNVHCLHDFGQGNSTSML